MTSPLPSPVARPVRRFATTRWSLILQARSREHLAARAALEELCEAYWLPVYGFMRRVTRDLHNAQDLTQGFFASLLSRDVFADLNPDRGRFRSFLLAAAKNFAFNEFDKRTTIIRGGNVVLHSMDYELGERQISHELSREGSPEDIFERRWALALLDRVLDRLREEYIHIGKSEYFNVLAPIMTGDHTGSAYQPACDKLQITPEAARVAIHRMRKRYRRILRDEIAQTTATPQEVDDEIRHLFSVLRRK